MSPRATPAARHPPPRAGLGPLGGGRPRAVPARRGAASRARRGRGDRRAGRRPGDGPARRPAGVRAGRPRPRRVLAAGQLQPRVAGVAMGAAPRPPVPLHRPAGRPLPGRRVDGEADGRPTTGVRRSAGRAGLGGGVRRRRAVVGRPGGASGGRRLRGDRGRHGRRARGPARRPRPGGAARGAHAPVPAGGRRGGVRACRPSCAAPGTSRRSPTSTRRAPPRTRPLLRSLPEGEGGHDLGAVVQPAPGRGHRLRRRRPGARLVPPPVRPRRSGGHRPLVLRGRRGAARRRPSGLARAGHRRRPPGRRRWPTLRRRPLRRPERGDGRPRPPCSAKAARRPWPCVHDALVVGTRGGVRARLDAHGPPGPGPHGLAAAPAPQAGGSHAGAGPAPSRPRGSARGCCTASPSSACPGGP